MASPPKVAIHRRIDMPGLGWAIAPIVTIPVGDRHHLPPEIDVTWPGDGHQPALKMHLAVVNGVPECRSITIESAEAGRGVMAKDLEAIRLVEWIEDIFALFAMEVASSENGQTTLVARDSDEAFDKSLESIRKARRDRRKLNREFLVGVAETYRANFDSNPTDAVRRAYNVAPRTAQGYVEKARKEGLLPATDQGKKRA